MSAPKIDQFGHFIDEHGDVTDKEPAPDHAFPIKCGPWPNENPGAIQRMCHCCGDLIGVSPKGLAYHDALPGLRPLLCGFCFEAIVVLLRASHGGVN
jgi:hypothetical protein